MNLLNILEQNDIEKLVEIELKKIEYKKLIHQMLCLNSNSLNQF